MPQIGKREEGNRVNGLGSREEENGVELKSTSNRTRRKREENERGTCGQRGQAERKLKGCGPREMREWSGRPSSGECQVDAQRGKFTTGKDKPVNAERVCSVGW